MPKDGIIQLKTVYTCRISGLSVGRKGAKGKIAFEKDRKNNFRIVIPSEGINAKKLLNNNE